MRAQLGEIGILRGSLMRDTLALQTMRLPTQAARLAWLAEHIHAMPGTGIVYALTKRDADQVADWLTRNGAAARAYYSGVIGEGFDDSDAYRRHLEDRLLRNEIKALVATTALGMGYDKPDLGFVIHYQAPGSIVAYYQQVGRAGRAIAYAIGILMAGDEDDEIHEYFRRSAFPKEEWVSAILAALEASDGLSIAELEEALNLRHGQIEHVLKFLSADNPAPVIKDGSRWRRTPVEYRMDHDRIHRLTGQREVEWHEVQSLCRRAGMPDGVPGARPRRGRPAAMRKMREVPGKTRGRADLHARDRGLGSAASPPLRNALEGNQRVAKDAFTEYGFRGILPRELRAETGRILSRWGDAGWGQLVAADKHDGHFRDELVAAVAEMIRDRWQPTPRRAGSPACPRHAIRRWSPTSPAVSRRRWRCRSCRP